MFGQSAYDLQCAVCSTQTPGQVQGQMPQLHLWYPSPAMCSKHKCRVKAQQKPVWRDETCKGKTSRARKSDGLPVQPVLTSVPEHQHQARPVRHGRSSSTPVLQKGSARQSQQHAQLELSARVGLQPMARPMAALQCPSEQQQAGLLSPGWRSDHTRCASLVPQQQQAVRAAHFRQPKHAEQYHGGRGSLHPSAELQPRLQPNHQHQPQPYRAMLLPNFIPAPKQRQHRNVIWISLLSLRTVCNCAIFLDLFILRILMSSVFYGVLQRWSFISSACSSVLLLLLMAFLERQVCWMICRSVLKCPGKRMRLKKIKCRQPHCNVAGQDGQVQVFSTHCCGLPSVFDSRPFEMTLGPVFHELSTCYKIPMPMIKQADTTERIISQFPSSSILHSNQSCWLLCSCKAHTFMCEGVAGNVWQMI